MSEFEKSLGLLLSEEHLIVHWLIRPNNELINRRDTSDENGGAGHEAAGSFYG